MINKKIGNEYEEKFAELLKSRGYWCHIFAYNKNGQPCDIVAIRNNIPYLIDVKHCDEDRFSFDKIQPNQITCFEYAGVCGNTDTGFAIWFSKQNRWCWLSYTYLKSALHFGMKSVKYDELGDVPL